MKCFELNPREAEGSYRASRAKNTLRYAVLGHQNLLGFSVCWRRRGERASRFPSPPHRSAAAVSFHYPLCPQFVLTSHFYWRRAAAATAVHPAPRRLPGAASVCEKFLRARLGKGGRKGSSLRTKSALLSSFFTANQIFGRNNMSPKRPQGVVMLLMLMVLNVSGAFVGITIGNDMSNLPSATDIVAILKAKKIQHVRLIDSDHQMLTALANTGIEVMVGVPNDQLLRVGQSRSTAADWINKNVATYVPATNITYIAVGDEVLTNIPNAALVLVPALQFLQSALLAANLNTQVKISSPQSMDMISKAFPPSTATFNSTWSSIMSQYLQFLKNTGSSFMLNAQPYYSYVGGQGVFPLEYALFRSLGPNSQISDPNTNLFYTNMFDAIIDATYNSIQAMNFTGIPVLVTASGWPWRGGPNEKAATVDNALAYNTNLIRHVLNNSGTPSQPMNQSSTYIFELFNEDLRSGPVSEKSWGIMFPNATTVYSLSFEDVATTIPESPALRGMFCVANSSAPHSALKHSLDWACGPGSANCSAIQPGQPCYESDNIVAVASYAFNDYYHRTQSSGGTCSFNGTAMITSTDPSHGSCIFAGSTGANSSGGGAASGPVSPDSFASKSQSCWLTHLVAALLAILVM